MRLDEIKKEIKAANPTLRRGSEEDGYVEIIGEEYEAIITNWAQAAYDAELKIQEETAKREAAEAKLAAIGITPDDLKALGLG
jgi:hypothetical protein